MTSVTLTPLAGSTPLGFLAALGTLAVAERAAADRQPTLQWTDELVPRAVLSAPESTDEAIDWVLRDLDVWRESALLNLTATDIKPSPQELHAWTAKMAERGRPEGDLFSALLAEGALAGKGVSKPTHLHFTAGQQQFLTMVRMLSKQVDRAALEEALVGPWQFTSTLPTLGWDTRGERVYALRGFDPSKEKRTGVPGADWLAILGLTFLPVFARDGRLLTTGCDADWKSGSFIWPIWDVPLSPRTIRSLLSYAGLRDESATQRRARGVIRVLRAPITRSDQGGYGSFRPPQAAEPRRPLASRRHDA